MINLFNSNSIFNYKEIDQGIDLFQKLILRKTANEDFLYQMPINFYRARLAFMIEGYNLKKLKNMPSIIYGECSYQNNQLEIIDHSFKASKSVNLSSNLLINLENCPNTKSLVVNNNKLETLKGLHESVNYLCAYGNPQLTDIKTLENRNLKTLILSHCGEMCLDFNLTINNRIGLKSAKIKYIDLNKLKIDAKCIISVDDIFLEYCDNGMEFVKMYKNQIDNLNDWPYNKLEKLFSKIDEKRRIKSILTNL